AGSARCLRAWTNRAPCRRSPRPVARPRRWSPPVLSAAVSLTVVEAIGQRHGQPRLLDRARGVVDRVLDAAPAGMPGLEVEEEPGGARVAVARLPDAAGVDDPVALGEVELRPTRRVLARD